MSLKINRSSDDQSYVLAVIARH